jgi:hypothetical protein
VVVPRVLGTGVHDGLAAGACVCFANL